MIMRLDGDILKLLSIEFVELVDISDLEIFGRR